jgi:hypothetical protein
MEGLQEFWDNLPTWAKVAIPLTFVGIIVLIWAPWKNTSSSSQSGILEVNTSNGTSIPNGTAIVNATSTVSNTTSNPVKNTTSVPVKNTTSVPVKNTTSPQRLIVNSTSQIVDVATQPIHNVNFIVANTQASNTERLAALQTALSKSQPGKLYPISLPGVPASIVGNDETLANNPAVTGVLPDGVLVINPNANQSDILNVLKYAHGVSIPGVSAGQAGYLQMLAKQGKLKGITSTGRPIF